MRSLSQKNSLSQFSEMEFALMNSVPLSSLRAANKRADELTAKYEDLLRQHEIQTSKSDQELKKLMSEIELERKIKHDLMKEFESLNHKYWSKNLPNEVSIQELVIFIMIYCFLFLQKFAHYLIWHNHGSAIIHLQGVRLAGVEAEVMREKQQAKHAEKMCDIVKGMTDTF